METQIRNGRLIMKMYVITRKDLPVNYRAVQAGHGLAEYMIKHPNDWQNETLVYLVVEDEYSLIKLANKLEYKNITYTKFHEPDIDNQLTAIAAYNDGKIFKNIKLFSCI